MENEHLPARKLERALAIEPRKRPAHRLDRKPEIVANVMTRHRQRNDIGQPGGTRQALAEAHQERRDLLLGGQPAKDRHLLLRSAELTGGQKAKPLQQRGMADDKPQPDFAFRATSDFSSTNRTPARMSRRAGAPKTIAWDLNAIELEVVADASGQLEDK